MKLTVFGGTGRVGQHVLRQAVDAGHDITAVVRNPRKLTVEVRTVIADLNTPDPATIQSAIYGADAVLSGLGPQKRAENGIVSMGTRAIVEAMTRTGTRRLVVISGVGVATIPVPDRPNPPTREPGAGLVMQYLSTPLTKVVLGEHLRDVALMEYDLRKTDLDWTVMRIPYVVDKPLTGVYRTARGHALRRGLQIGRADAAHLMLTLAGQPQTVREVVTVGY
ncbi:NAD-dependent epimerase/dehydratase family protein [Nonomuraea sp. MG754425]|uniref:NAD(P)-dependent oxidoreductase n=1 Tax=Nonomuraea sp. MG754425 TaxID=2570319 RepID=UPI001F3C2E55|nr:NAD(P)H-binding protein [Nonomuraea sp. MG754425]MCF6476399.1 NAD-dependent epimerase/dehydratase family protein [Nonomuraea sp. MG754425]